MGRGSRGTRIRPATRRRLDNAADHGSDFLELNEEADLLDVVHKGRHARRRLLSEEDIDDLEYLRLTEAVVEGDKARERIVLAHIPLVVSIARNMPGEQAFTFEDRLQEGCIGLLRAVDKYRLDKGAKQGVRFNAYAKYWVLDSIRRGREASDRLIRIPRSAERCNDALTRSLKRPFIDISSLNDSITHEHNEIDQVLGQIAAEQIISMLGFVESQVLRSRYGVSGDPLTLDQVAELTGLSKDVVRAAEAAGLAKLQHPAAQRRIWRAN